MMEDGGRCWKVSEVMRWLALKIQTKSADAVV